MATSSSSRYASGVALIVATLGLNKVECRAADREEHVSVPAGTFTTVRATCRFMPAGNPSHELWYSPNVRNLVRENTHFSYGVRERELTSYKVEGS